ncbi:hypothetical protein H0H93_014259 [Arthromyces matolae]|nr:hypothetical protein H0H93_014259 [Arthromyces matolae]
MSSDYVIIGSGLCGTVLAARLSENPDVTVTVLEAGSAPFRTENIDVPGNARSFVLEVMGKGIGGSTLVTPSLPILVKFREVLTLLPAELHATQPVPLEKLGSKGWTWDSLVPYFKKSESLVYNEEDAKTHRYNLDPNYHGTSGPLRKRVPAFFNIANDPWIEAVEKQGIKHNPDPSSGNVTGVWSNLVTADENSVRSSAGKVRPPQAATRLGYD